MIEYELVVEESCRSLQREVQAAISEGWLPHGGVTAGYRDEFLQQEPLPPSGPGGWSIPPAPKRRMYWVQAMIRKGETK